MLWSAGPVLGGWCLGAFCVTVSFAKSFSYDAYRLPPCCFLRCGFVAIVEGHFCFFAFVSAVFTEFLSI